MSVLLQRDLEEAGAYTPVFDCNLTKRTPAERACLPDSIQVAVLAQHTRTVSPVCTPHVAELRKRTARPSKTSRLSHAERYDGQLMLGVYTSSSSNSLRVSSLPQAQCKVTTSKRWLQAGAAKGHKVAWWAACVMLPCPRAYLAPQEAAKTPYDKCPVQDARSPLGL